MVVTLENSGLSIPDKLGVVLYYKEPRTRNYSGLSIDSVSVGQVAARLLVSMIENNQRGLPAKATTTYVDATCWDQGASLRDAAPDTTPALTKAG